jgi:hypothetical protein
MFSIRGGRRDGDRKCRHQDLAHQEGVTPAHKMFSIRGGRRDGDRKCRHWEPGSPGRCSFCTQEVQHKRVETRWRQEMPSSGSGSPRRCSFCTQDVQYKRVETRWRQKMPASGAGSLSPPEGVLRKKNTVQHKGAKQMRRPRAVIRISSPFSAKLGEKELSYS